MPTRATPSQPVSLVNGTILLSFKLFFFTALLLLAFAGCAKEDKVFTVEKVLDDGSLLLDNGEIIAMEGVLFVPVSPKDGIRYNYLNPKGMIETIQFMREAIQGRKVTIEFIPTFKRARTRDGQGRYLGYVYRVPDKWFLNAEIIKHGYGWPLPYEHRYSDDFNRYFYAEREHINRLWDFNVLRSDEEELDSPERSSEFYYEEVGAAVDQGRSQ